MIGQVHHLPSPAHQLVEAVARIGASAAVQPSTRDGYSWQVETASRAEAIKVGADLLCRVRVPEVMLVGHVVYVRFGVLADALTAVGS